MKFKFEDKVVVQTSDFYTGAEGIITNYDKHEDRYEVQLAYACSRWFYAEQLKKVTVKTKLGQGLIKGMKEAVEFEKTRSKK